MAESLEEAYYIVVRDFEDNLIKKGVIGKIEEIDQTHTLEFCNFESAGRKVRCRRDFLQQLDPEDFMVLMGISDTVKRYELYNDNARLNEVKGLQPEDNVTVHVGNEFEQMEGVLKVREKPKDSQGFIFGVLLNAEHKGKGTSNGFFKGEQYFNCDKNCAVFVTAYRVRASNRKQVAQSKVSNVAPDDFTVSLRSRPDATSEHLLKVGERVVWISDEGPEKGTVKWVGILDEEREAGLVTGVEFDNPIGKGTGKYHGRELFKARRGHASLVPAVGLMRLSEYDNQQSPSVQPDVIPEQRRDGEGDTTRNVSIGLGDRVAVKLQNVVYGIVRWMDTLSLGNQDIFTFGLEMETTHTDWSDGTYHGKRYFQCEQHHAFFVPAKICRPA